MTNNKHIDLKVEGKRLRKMLGLPDPKPKKPRKPRFKGLDDEVVDIIMRELDHAAGLRRVAKARLVRQREEMMKEREEELGRELWWFEKEYIRLHGEPERHARR